MAATEPREKDDSLFLVTGNLDSHPECVMQRIHLHEDSYAKFQLRKKKDWAKRIGGVGVEEEKTHLFLIIQPRNIGRPL